MRHLFILVIWFAMSSSLLIISTGFYIHGERTGNRALASEEATTLAKASSNKPVYILKPEVLGVFTNEIIASDARPKIVASFLKRYDCPLKPYDYYAEQFVQIADNHKLDFRLLPAISMQESNCCKKIPQGSNNCWGYGIYGEKITTFPTYEAGMERVAETLQEKYVKQGLLEPEEIMSKYTPSSKGSWATGVLHFMSVMKETTLSTSKS